MSVYKSVFRSKTYGTEKELAVVADSMTEAAESALSELDLAEHEMGFLLIVREDGLTIEFKVGRDPQLFL